MTVITKDDVRRLGVCFGLNNLSDQMVDELREQMINGIEQFKAKHPEEWQQDQEQGNK